MTPAGTLVLCAAVVVLTILSVYHYATRNQPTPCRYCGTTHATDVERRACNDRGLA